jgi:CHAT domain-containing protein
VRRAFTVAAVLCLLPLAATAAGRTGIIVESVDEPSATARAGILPGDRLVSWERPAAPPGSPELADGAFRTPFDLDEVVLEQAPRGPVRIELVRDGETLHVEVPVGEWRLAVRPVLEEPLLSAYLKAVEALDSEDPSAGLDALRVLAEDQSEAGNAELAAWLHARRAQYHKRSYAGEACVPAAEAAREAAATITDPVTRYHLRDLLITCLDYANRLDETREMLLAAQREHGDQADNSLAAARELELLSTMEWLAENLAEAQRIDEQVLAIQERLAPRGVQTAVVLRNLGYLHAMVGRVAISEPYFQRSYDIIAEVAPESQQMMATIAALSYLAAKRGNPEQQIEYLQRAQAFCERSGCDPEDVAINYSHLSSAHEKLGDLKEAERLELLALEIRQVEEPDSQAVATSLGALGNIRFRMGKLEGAREMMEQALAMQSRATGERSLSVTAIHRDLGDLSRDQGDPAAARRHYEIALSILQEFAPGTIAEAAAQYRLGLLAREEERLEDALRFFLGAVESLESQTRNLGGSQEEVSGYRARYAHYYRDLIEVLLELGRPGEAFDALERSRSRVLLAMLADRELFFRDPPTQALAEEKADADAAYDDALRDLARASSNPEVDEAGRQEIRARLAERRREQQEVQARIRAEAPRLAAIQDPQPLRLAAVREVLPDDTLLLSYLLGPEDGYLFALGPGTHGLAVHPIPLGEAEIGERVERLRRMVQGQRGRRGRSALQREAADLGRLLLGPVSDRLGEAERLLVLPDGPLYLLPFAVLGDPGSADDFRFLVEAIPLHVSSSATVLARTRPAAPGGAVIAFGNPDYPAAGSGGAAAEVVTRAGIDLVPLPATEAEARTLERVFPGARVYLGGDATEGRAKSLPEHVSVLHLAAHGWVDERSPLESAIALTLPEAPAPGEDNGLLQAWEVFESVHVDADLVTLSACNTALGKNLAGEGIIGLSRAFQFAGARSVLASLWPVSDASTALLMEHFYRAMAAGSPRDEALRRAQLFLLHPSADRPDAPPVDTTAPFYWAGFQLLGPSR